MLEVNPAAVRILRRQSASEMLGKHPGDFSPPFQPSGESSADRAREYIGACMTTGSARFDWLACDPNDKEIFLEVNLTRIEWSGRQVIQAFITDITERKRAERALRESETKFRALFEGASQGVLLRDEHQFLEVNPAAVRILGRRSAHELLGTHPIAFSPPFQPSGESSAVLTRKYTEECIAQGSVRFEWLACDPRGREIPVEVNLTRIEWGGRRLIQAFISDISERKRAQAALAESEARFSVAFQASPALVGVLRQSDGAYVMANDAFVNWLGCPREKVIGHTSAEFGMWVNPEERESALNTMRTQGSIRHSECSWRNRHGETLTVLLSAETIQVHNEPHILSFAIDITQRKQAEAELRETEARFSAAFQASPALIGILRMSDGRYVLANDAHLNWLGYTLEEICGRTCLELGMWEDPRERDRKSTRL